MLTTRKGALAYTAAWTAVAVAGVWAVLAGLADRLPDPMAVHWNTSSPNRGEGVTAFALQLSAFYLLGAAFALAAAWKSDLALRANRLSIGAGLGMWAGIALGTASGTAVANIDAATWQDAALSGSDLALTLTLIIALPLVTGLLGAVLAGRRPDEPRPEADAAPTLDVPTGERLAWSRRQGTGTMYIALIASASVLVVVGLFAGDDASRTAVLAGLGVLVLVALAFGGFAVTVGAQGVQVRLGLLGRPRWRIPLDTIESAHVEERGPAQVGGWGLRIVPGRTTAVMMRKGECLILRRKGKSEAVISVDDAATAASVVNTLLARRTRTH